MTLFCAREVRKITVKDESAFRIHIYLCGTSLRKAVHSSQTTDHGLRTTIKRKVEILASHAIIVDKRDFSLAMVG